MKRSKTKGFSLLEIIAAVVILAVVAAATVATVAPLRARSDEKLAAQEIATLNAISHSYFQKNGRYPAGVADLVEEGYLANTASSDDSRLDRFEQNYRYDPTTGRFSRR